jgi:mRNA interferase MazF
VTWVAYVPERGDAAWISLNPQSGHEDVGRGPAVVLPPGSYNGKVGLALFCPITNQVKGYSFGVAIPIGLRLSGAVLADQVKSLEWRARRVELICALPQPAVSEVLQKLGTLS